VPQPGQDEVVSQSLLLDRPGDAVSSRTIAEVDESDSGILRDHMTRRFYKDFKALLRTEPASGGHDQAARLRELFVQPAQAAQVRVGEAGRIDGIADDRDTRGIDAG